MGQYRCTVGSKWDPTLVFGKIWFMQLLLEWYWNVCSYVVFMISHYITDVWQKLLSGATCIPITRRKCAEIPGGKYSTQRVRKHLVRVHPGLWAGCHLYWWMWKGSRYLPQISGILTFTNWGSWCWHESEHARGFAMSRTFPAVFSEALLWDDAWGVEMNIRNGCQSLTPNPSIKRRERANEQLKEKSRERACFNEDVCSVLAPNMAHFVSISTTFSWCITASKLLLLVENQL